VPAAPAATGVVLVSRPVAVATPAPIVAGIGQSLVSADLHLTARSAVRANNFGGLTASAGRTFVIAEVILSSTRRTPVPFTPSDFRLRDDTSAEYKALVPSGDESRSLKARTLAPGETIAGAVAFDVPAGARALVLSFQPSTAIPDYQPIRIGLGD
jgi:hypothetical protein